MKRMISSLVLLAIFTALTSSAGAASRFALDLPVGGSIALPGPATATFTNPAGLIGNRGIGLTLEAGSDHPMDNPTYRGLLLMGNGSLAVSGGLDYQVLESANNPASAVYGLALNLNFLNLVIGAAGRTQLREGNRSEVNAGLLFTPIPYFSIGATAMSAEHGVDSYGAGVSLSLFDGVDVVVDGATDSDFKHRELKPGLKISNQFAGISLSYGTGETSQFSKDVSAGAFLRLSANAELELNYNHGGRLPKYYAALSFGI